MGFAYLVTVRKRSYGDIGMMVSMKSLVKIMVMVLGVLATSSCRTGLLPTTVNSGGGGSILASLPALPSDVQSSGKYVLSCDKIIPIEAMASQQTCAGESSQCQVTFTVPQDVTLQEGQECKVGVWAKVDIKKYVYAVAERSGDRFCAKSANV
jgi:hypothetical protein